MVMKKLYHLADNIGWGARASFSAWRIFIKPLDAAEAAVVIAATAA
jgi:hypothetical protein